MYLVELVMKIHASVVLLTILADVWGFKLQPGLSGRRGVATRRLMPLFSDNDGRKDLDGRRDLDSLLGEAESADAEWLNSVFDPSMRDMLGGAVNDTPSTTDGQDSSGSLENCSDDRDGGVGAAGTPAQIASKDSIESSLSSAPPPKRRGVVDADTAMLYRLGYKDADIALIKPKVLQVILESGLSLPSRGIPERWLIESDSDSAPAITDSGDAPIESGSASVSDSDGAENGLKEEKLVPEQLYTSLRSERRADSPSPEPRPGVPVRRIRERDVAGEGEGFSWKGGEDKPKGRKTSTQFEGPLSRPTNRDAARSRRLAPGRERRGRGGEGGDRSRGRNLYDGFEDEDDYDYVDDSSPEIGGEGDELMRLGVTTANPFWPSQDEFQDMLLQESLWRINIIGKWVTPFVKAEAKWRNRLYEDFMYVLDEGLGDGFDTVAGEAFGADDEYYDDGYDDEYDDEDDEEEYERGFGDYYDDSDGDDDGDGRGLSAVDEGDDEDGERGAVRRQFPSNTRTARIANPGPPAGSLRERSAPARSSSLALGEGRGRGQGGRALGRGRGQGRGRNGRSTMWNDDDEGRAARARAARKYSQDLAERMGQDDEWVDVNEVEREASQRAKRGLKVIKKIAKGSVPGQVYDALREERDRIQSDASYYGYDDEDDYDEGYATRSRGQRRRGGGGRSRRRREVQIAARPSPRGRGRREPSLTRESLFSDGTDGALSSRGSNDYDDDDDFYEVDVDSTAAGMGAITTKEEYDAAYEASRNRAPREE